MEWLWCNYPEPVALHDYRFLGDDFQERERIKRKKQRWVHRLQSMPTLERQALLAALGEASPRPSLEMTIPARITPPAAIAGSGDACPGPLAGDDDTRRS